MIPSTKLTWLIWFNVSEFHKVWVWIWKPSTNSRKSKRLLWGRPALQKHSVWIIQIISVFLLRGLPRMLCSEDSVWGFIKFHKKIKSNIYIFSLNSQQRRETSHVWGHSLILMLFRLQETQRLWQIIKQMTNCFIILKLSAFLELTTLMIFICLFVFQSSLYCNNINKLDGAILHVWSLLIYFFVHATSM